MSEEIKDIQTQSDSSSQTSSYRSIFKATSLFGGVQVFQIIIGIIKQKFVAVLLGTVGMGIMGLYQSGLQLVQSISSMGLSQSAVRDVSEANGSGDIKRVSRTIAVLRRLVWLTGILGMVAMIVFSPLLSKSLFGNHDYTLSFIILSIVLLLDQISAGQRALLQGLRKLKDLARASVFGVTIGLFVSVPLYYIMGIKGIVPTLILNSVTSLILIWFFARKVKIEISPVTMHDTIKEGKGMLILGLSMSIAGILSLAYAYVLRGFICNLGGLEQVGLFTAGFAIVNTYIGMIFSAMSTDYFPRLAAVNKDARKCNNIINQQIEIASLIMGPLLVLCLVFMPIVIRILYSSSFLPANDFVFWATSGMLFKLASWAIAYLIIAKGDAVLFVINELMGSTVNFVCCFLGYKYWGLTGLGVGFSISYFIYFLQVYIITYKRYGFNFSQASLKLWFVQIAIVLFCLLLVLFFDSWQRYVFGSLVAIESVIISLKGLDKRMMLLSIIKLKRNGKDK